MAGYLNEIEMREAFALFDKDGDGCITSSELLTVMCSLGQPATEQETKNMIQQVDTDGNGLIDFDEFLEMMEARLPTRHRSQDAEMRALFAAFDKDNNGYIDAVELKATMHDVGMELTDRDIEMMMKAAGVAIKDRIFYEDFVKMMTGNIGLGQPVADSQVPQASHSPPALGYATEDAAMQELRVAFSMFDKDGDGQISVQEVHNTMRSLGFHIDISQVKLMVKHVDTDGDGTISFEEFRQVLEKYKTSKRETGRVSPTESCASELDLQETFQIFDKDGDGFLNAVDLRSTMKQLGMSLSEDDVHAMMRSVGVGPHGKISYPDFCKMFQFNGKQTLGKEVKVCPRKRASENFTSEQQRELHAVFSVFDKDGDGFISVEEVGKVLASMGIHPSEDYICEIFRQVDLDGNNQIDFREFLLLVQNYERPLSEEQEIREMFNAIDTDRSGFIDVDELRSTFANLGVPLSTSDVREMLKEAHIQGTRIFYEDFVQIMMGKIGQAQKEHLANFPSPAPVVEHVCVNAAAPVTESSPPTFDEAQLKELHIQFAQFDKDCDGVISPKELCQVMNSLGLKIGLDVVKKVLHRADLDSDGRIEFSDFCKLMSHQKNFGSREESRLEEQDTRQVFRVFDKNRDGYIDEQELRQTMHELGMILSADDINAMMTKAGCKITGRIYYEEFVKIMFGEMLKPDSKTRPSPISDEVLQELRVAFAMVDKDGDGRITPRELMSVMAGLGFKSDDIVIKQMISRFDADGNGTLEFDEFRDMMKASMDGTTRWEKLKKAHTPPDTWKAFKIFDRNADGYISKTELYQTMKELGVKLSMDDLNEMMKAADVNQDGRIDYAEFSKLMTGAFKSFAKQAAQLNEQLSLYEAIFQQNLSPSDLQQAFERVDTDKDGIIGVDELKQVAQSLGFNVSQPQAESIMERYGTKGKGTMDLNQFMTALSRADDSRTSGKRNRAASGGGATAEREDMHTAFRVFDSNSDGFIDATELRATMHELTGDTLTDADVDAMIRSADRDGDGRINYEEFVQMMRAK